MAQKHIVKSFDEQLSSLRRTIVEMGGEAERQIGACIDCVRRRDATMAGAVVEADYRLDLLEKEIDQAAIRLLALRQPMATDLREIVAALKIAADLERIGDYAANVAKRAISLSQTPAVRPVSAIPRMGRLVQEILSEVLDAYTRRDVGRAMGAWSRDEEVDDLYTSLFRETLTYMMEDPRTISPCTHLLFVAKNIERIGDHATNIAETIHFLEVGEALTARRPKGDISSFEVVAPRQVDDEP
ncbi:MAG: phosphate signaling complex protein PhoU [Rhodospirillaceae bacterium]|nr:phosphate signaling complex protein PhoU [Rhodospirillaceae bacterium]